MAGTMGATSKSQRGPFDQLAEAISRVVGRAPFFTACLMLVIVWFPVYWLFPDFNTWQLVLNTITSVVTFLLVALLQNAQRRGEQALQRKLDAIAEGVADVMEHLNGQNVDLSDDIGQLRSAVGLEERIGA